ncbi:MAG: hypothetical protein JW891_04670 [Candidatus Lokiarchaeota archaeon]|nr:hypothetical protein [Candidatus Lokiarchaeota archaeon]
MNIKKNLPTEIEKAHQSFERGEFEGALSALDSINVKSNVTYLDRLKADLLKSDIYFRLRKDLECFKHAELAYQASERLKMPHYSFDALLNMAWGLFWLGDFQKGLELISKSEELLKTLTQLAEQALKRREASLLFVKATAHWFLANVEEGQKCVEKSLEIRQKLGISHEIVESLSLMSGYLTYFQKDLDKALSVLEQCQSSALENKHPWAYSFNPKNFAVIYYMKGNLEKALECYKCALAYFENQGNIFPAITTISEMGNIYREMGDLDLCLKYLERGLKVAMQTKNNWALSEAISNLIEVLVVKGEIDRAKKHLELLENINKEDPDNKQVEQSYMISMALVLKTSSRIHDRVNAREILNKVLQVKTTTNEHTIIALLNQAELLIDELRLTRDLEIIDEIQVFIKDLLETTTKLRSYWYLAETHVLQAKLALLTFNLIDARLYLTKAQELAEKHGMKRLAVKISSEHDELLQKLNIWEQLKESKMESDQQSTLQKRIELTQLDEQMKRLIQKRRVDPPKIIKDIPLMILIVSEGGVPAFSKIFSDTLDIKDNIVSSFLSVFNTFIVETFSEGLDRANFGQYTLLVKPFLSFLFCYIFKGHSYCAQQKIHNFLDSLKNDEKLVNEFNNYYKTNQAINIENFPKLESIIKNIFVE